MVHVRKWSSIQYPNRLTSLEPEVKAPWTSILGALEGAIASVFATGLLVGVLGWHLNSTSGSLAFLAAVLLGAVAGWPLGAKVAHRRAARLATQVRT